MWTFWNKFLLPLKEDFNDERKYLLITTNLSLFIMETRNLTQPRFEIGGGDSLWVLCVFGGDTGVSQHPCENHSLTNIIAGRGKEWGGGRIIEKPSSAYFSNLDEIKQY